MPRTEQHSALLFERIFDAAVRIIALYSDLPTEDVRFICGKLRRLLSAEFGLAIGEVEDLSAEERLQIFHRGAALLSQELRQRNVEPAVISELMRDLEAFYRGVRNIPSQS